MAHHHIWQAENVSFTSTPKEMHHLNLCGRAPSDMDTPGNGKDIKPALCRPANKQGGPNHRSAKPLDGAWLIPKGG